MIFINYRRDDTMGTAGQLHDRLAQAFGRKNLFMDVDHIPPGVDFVDHLNNQVAACDVFIAVIGPNWLDSRNEDGDRRLHTPDDFVTVEIAAALARDIRVIPVLVDAARMPKASDLPELLKPLLRRHAITLRHDHFGRDAQALIEKIREALRAKPASNIPKWQAAGVVAALLLLGSIGLFVTRTPLSLLWEMQPRVQAEKEQAAKEQAAKEQAAKEQAAKEQAAKDRLTADGPAGKPVIPKLLGLDLSELSTDLRRKYKIKSGVKGVVITGVDAGSDAAEKRLSAGDIIVEVSQSGVLNVADIKALLDQLKKAHKRSVLLLVSNADGELRFVALSAE